MAQALRELEELKLSKYAPANFIKVKGNFEVAFKMAREYWKQGSKVNWLYLVD